MRVANFKAQNFLRHLADLLTELIKQFSSALEPRRPSHLSYKTEIILDHIFTAYFSNLYFNNIFHANTGLFTNDYAGEIPCPFARVEFVVSEAYLKQKKIKVKYTRPKFYMKHKSVNRKILWNRFHENCGLV